MRLLTSKLRRCWPPPPLPQLQCFFCHYTSSSSSSTSHYLFSSLPHHQQHHLKGQHNFNPRWSPELCPLSPHDCVSFSRRFSTHPDTPKSDEAILPLQAIISLLDSYHEATGLPWWLVISSSTVAMRLALFPFVVLQLKKLRRIGELLPTLPPPFPPPLSGQSFRNQISLFLKEKKASGCPSLFWWFSTYAIQVPCFFMWLMSVRRMSLDHHTGFDTGGMLWFQNLTEYPHGALGLVFPFFIAGLHFTNVQTPVFGEASFLYLVMAHCAIQISFKKSALQQSPGSFRLLLKIYQIYLQVLTLPILIAAFNVPQGSLVYWLSNSSWNLIQLLCLQNPRFLEYLGIPRQSAPVVAPSNKERCSSGVADIVILTKTGEIPAVDLSPAVLVAYSIKIITDGHKDTAVRLLRLALMKDPGNVRALLTMGQTLLQDKQYSEAAGWLESAVSKLLEAGYPTEVEEVDLLILSSIWAGIANVQQGKMVEGLRHLKRIAQLDEPEHPTSKSHYFDGLLVLSGALMMVDRKSDALEYLEKVIAYDPAYSVYLEEFKRDPNNIASDLASSRREL